VKVIFAVIGLFSFSTLACAEVSDDLKFCGSLKSGPERLSCYDAAARIASRPATMRPAARAAPVDAQAAVAVKAVAPDPLPARNPFDGYYAAIGGGYGVITGRGNSLSDPFGFASGASAAAVAGRNIGFNWGIVGIEVDGRWLGETANTSAILNPGFFLSSGTGIASYRYQDDLAAHVALRMGVTYGDSLIFAKAGVGVVRVTETFVSDTRGILFCDPKLFPIFGASCSPTGFGVLNSAKVATWLPSAIFGLGIEQNWGPFFGRLGVDFEATNHRSTNGSVPFFFNSSVDQITWATRGTALIGVRF
jgi:hypothetical protein